MHLHQMQSDDDQYQREHIAEIVPCVTQQGEAVLPKANAGFNTNEKEIQYNGCP